jgi:hypothetical protein
MQFPPSSRHFIPLWSEYSPQHSVLKNPQPMLFFQIKLNLLSLATVTLRTPLSSWDKFDTDLEFETLTAEVTNVTSF